MLQTIRDKITGWVAIIFLGAIAVVFIFFGVDMSSSSSTIYAAKVNGEGITIEEVRRSWQEREQRLQQMFRGAVPEAMLKPQQQQVLDEHIRSELLTQHASELGYRASDDMLRKTINGFAELQVDGQFSNERYILLLKQQGRTRAQFESDLRSNMAIDHLQRGIAASAFVTPSELARLKALEGEQRDIDFANIAAANFLTSVSVTDADIQQWYDTHLEEYMTPETVDLDYIELKLADVAAGIPLTDQALRSYYDQVKERLTTPERRRARHILITVDDPANDAAALAKAQDVLVKVQGGGDFAALAKQFSQDTVSAANGGDLDWATRGMFVGPFEEALFSMTRGEVRGPIKTQFGYHIIRLDETEGGDTKSFEAARAELESEYRNEQAQAQFYERSQKMADDAFAALTDLAPVAQSLGLPLQKIPGFSRQGGGAFGTNPQVIEAAFRPEAIQKGENSPLISVADDHSVILRVSGHQPPAQRPLTAVRNQIEIKLKLQAASAAAAKRGEELLALLNSGTPWLGAVSQAKLSAMGERTVGRTTGDLPAPVRQAAFDVPRSAVSSDKPAYRGVVLEDGSYAVVAVLEVKPGVFQAGTPESAAEIRQAAQTQGGKEFSAYMKAVELSADVERNPRTFE